VTALSVTAQLTDNLQNPHMHKNAVLFPCVMFLNDCFSYEVEHTDDHTIKPH